MGLGDLGDAYEEGEGRARGEERDGDREDGFKMFDGAEGDESRGRGKGFGAGREYIDIGQCKCPDDFAKEGDLLVVGLDECNRSLGRPDFHGQAGKAGTGTDVH